MKQDIDQVIQIKKIAPATFEQNLVEYNAKLNRASATFTLGQHPCFIVRILQQNRDSCLVKNCLPVKDLQILDIGCENGSLAKKLGEEAKLVVGIDLDKNMIKEAKKCASKNTHLAIGDARCLPFENEVFDITICGCVLPHVLKPNMILNEIMRVTKKGGRIVLSVSNDELLKYPKRLLKMLHLDTMIKGIDNELPPAHLYEGGKRFFSEIIKTVPNFRIDKILGDIPLFPTMIFVIGHKL